MARIRSIKPDFFLHETLAELGPLHRLLFIGLWTLADREGRVEDRPKRIKVSLLPYDDCDVDAMLNDLGASGFIARYEAEGKQCIEIPGFLEHQRPHPKEPESTIPAPAKTGKGRVSREKKRPAAEEHGETVSDRVVSGGFSGGGKGVEMEAGAEGAAAPDAAAPPSPPADAGADSSSIPPADAGGESSSSEPARPADLQALWNEIAVPKGLPRWDALEGQRLTHTRARLKEHPDLAWWRQVIEHIVTIPGLIGQAPGRDGRTWKAHPNKLVTPGWAASVLEGAYDSWTGTPSTGPPPDRPKHKGGYVGAEEIDWSKARTGRIED